LPLIRDTFLTPSRPWETQYPLPHGLYFQLDCSICLRGCGTRLPVNRVVASFYHNFGFAGIFSPFLRNVKPIMPNGASLQISLGDWPKESLSSPSRPAELADSQSGLLVPGQLPLEPEQRR